MVLPLPVFANTLFGMLKSKLKAFLLPEVIVQSVGDVFPVGQSAAATQNVASGLVKDWSAQAVQSE
jgi:hypothetical protein